MRTVFLCLAAAALAVCILLTFLFRRTPEKAVRQMMDRLEGADRETMALLLGSEASAGDPEALSACEAFYSDFSCKIFKGTSDGSTAEVPVIVTTPDTSRLARDIRLSALRGEGGPFTVMQRLLGEGHYGTAETQGTVSLSKISGSWHVNRTGELEELITGNLASLLADPYLLSPSEVLDVTLSSFRSFTAEDWSEWFAGADLFGTGAAEYEALDKTYLEKITGFYDYEIGEASSGRDSVTLPVTITSINMDAVLSAYKKSLLDYADTTQAITDGSAALTSASADALLKALNENADAASFEVSVRMENNGTTWEIADSSGLTDALLGGMEQALAHLQENP